ncbi:MAG TPA: polyprenyl synthetase family protein [Ktedonobacterales bacterium]|jgi:geranylgeranyl pyrophosphate synthase
MSNGPGFTLPGRGLLPESFRQSKEYKRYTSRHFLGSFRAFIDEVACFGGGVLDPAQKSHLNEVAQSVVDTRGRGIEAWLTLQAYRQCLKRPETPAHLTVVTELAVAYYAKFAAYETLDDLPAFDNDPTRRNALSIWKKYGEETAILFAHVLSAYVNRTILNLALDQPIKLQLLGELCLVDTQTLIGESIHLGAEDVALPDAINITLQAHALKASSFGAHIMATAALAAQAPEEVATMRKLGYAMAACGQIVNDADYGAVEHDRETNAPNMITAAGWKGAEEIFRKYKSLAEEILDRYEQPNKHLRKRLTEYEQLLTERAAKQGHSAITVL